MVIKNNNRIRKSIGSKSSSSSSIAAFNVRVSAFPPWLSRRAKRREGNPSPAKKLIRVKMISSITNCLYFPQLLIYLHFLQLFFSISTNHFFFFISFVIWEIHVIYSDVSRYVMTPPVFQHYHFNKYCDSLNSSANSKQQSSYRFYSYFTDVIIAIFIIIMIRSFVHRYCLHFCYRGLY